MWLFTIYISSLVRCPFKSFARFFFLGLFVFQLLHVRVLYQTCALQIFLLRTVLLRTVLKFEEAQFIIFNFVNHAFGVVSKKCSSPFQHLAHGLYAFVAQSMLVKSRVREQEAGRLRDFGPGCGTTRDSRKQCSRELLRNQCGWLVKGFSRRSQRQGSSPGQARGNWGSGAIVSCHSMKKMTFFCPFLPSLLPSSVLPSTSLFPSHSFVS